MEIKENYPLKELNTFGLNVKARYYAEIASQEDLCEITRRPEFADNKKLILGGGSNLLFTGNFEGIVLKNNIRGIEKYKEDEAHIWYKIGGGENWHQLVRYIVDKGYGGIENLSLIPGTVGAAPMQNIGAYGTEIREVFEFLEALKLTDCSKEIFNNEDCEFGYRQSIFKKELKDQYIIAWVVLRLDKKPKLNISYAALKNYLEEMGIQDPDIKSVSDAVISIRQSKLPNPEELGNAGSFFKNPVVSRSKFEQLKKEYPDIVGFPLDDQRVKLAAGWLIERCGWKGKVVGNTGSHKKQSLVLVNYGNASGAEIWDLAKQIKQSVYEKFGVQLEPEVNIV